MDIDPNKAIEYMIRAAPEYAKAKAARVYIENFLRTKKALLMQSSKVDTMAAQERDAYAHPEYSELLAGLRDAVEREEALKWKLIAAQARVDVWRTNEANARATAKAAT